jgi:hypothetical protein
MWSRNGRELFYWRDDQMLAVDMTTSPSLRAGSPRALFRVQRIRSGLTAPGYDVASDGRFLIVQPLHPDPPTNQINVVLNWLEELKRLVPAN